MGDGTYAPQHRFPTFTKDGKKRILRATEERVTDTICTMEFHPITYGAAKRYVNPYWYNSEDPNDTSDRANIRGSVVVALPVGEVLVKQGFSHIYTPDTGPASVVRSADGNIKGCTRFIRLDAYE